MSRDRYNILLFGPYSNRPALGEKEQYYIVTGTGTNKGRAYKGNGTGWDEIALPLIPWANITGAPAAYAPTDHALDPATGPHTGDYPHDIDPDEGPHTGGLPWSHLENVPSEYNPTAHALDPAGGPHTGGLPWASITGAPSFLTEVTNHGNEKHSGMILARGYDGFSMAPTDDCPTGAGIWKGRVYNIAITNTKVYLEKVALWFDTAPAASIDFPVRVNGVVKATISIASEHAEVDIDPDIELADKDEITLDAPANIQGARGIIFRYGLKRVVD